MMEVSFQTKDDVTIFADYYTPQEFLQGQLKGIILIHMMPETKSSFKDFAEKLTDENFFALAIDLRGHGKSTDYEGIKLDYSFFTDTEHQKSILDIGAGVDFFKKKIIQTYAVIGASIGANLALWYQSSNTDVAKTVLLSPGYNYRGIKIQPLLLQLEESQGIYFIGGSTDNKTAALDSGQNAGQIVQVLYNETRVRNKKMEILSTDAHGTELFKFDSTLMDRVIVWLGNEN